MGVEELHEQVEAADKLFQKGIRLHFLLGYCDSQLSFSDGTLRGNIGFAFSIDGLQHGSAKSSSHEIRYRIF